MQQEAKLTGIRWDYSAKGYNDIIQKEFSEVGDTASGTAGEYRLCHVAQNAVQLLIIQAAYQPLDFAGSVAEFLALTAQEGADAFVQLFNFVHGNKPPDRFGK